MGRYVVSAAVVVLVAAAGTHGDGSNQTTVQELKAEVKQLRALEKTELHEIAARYDRWIAKLKNPEYKLEEIRAELRIEEKIALKNAPTEEQKKQIRKRYLDVRNILTGDIRADKQVIHRLQQYKKEEEKIIRVAFMAKIKELEAAIQLLENTAKPKR